MNELKIAVISFVCHPWCGDDPNAFMEDEVVTISFKKVAFKKK